MTDAIIFIKWENYSASPDSPPFFSRDPVTFNSQQERLHQLAEGNRLWLVSRSPTDQQYYFVAVLSVRSRRVNSAEGSEENRYGDFAIVAEPSKSHDLHTSFPAEGLLRAFEFTTRRPIKQGASIGQSLQTLRFLSPEDSSVLSDALRGVLGQAQGWATAPCGLWTKCDGYLLITSSRIGTRSGAHWRSCCTILPRLCPQAPPSSFTPTRCFV